MADTDSLIISLSFIIFIIVRYGALPLLSTLINGEERFVWRGNRSLIYPSLLTLCVVLIDDLSLMFLHELSHTILKLSISSILFSANVMLRNFRVYRSKFIMAT